LGTAAEANTGTDVGNIPAIVQRGHGRHVSSMYMQALSLAMMGTGTPSVGDEYMIAAIDPGTTDGINPCGFIGRFFGSRGGKNSSNYPGIQDVMVQASYRNNGVTISMSSPMLGNRNIFTGAAVSATYKGKKVYALKLPSSGGPFDNGIFFDGVIFRDNDASDIFSVVRASELTNIADLSQSSYNSMPVTSTTRRVVGTAIDDIPYVGAFGLGVAGLNRPASAANGFISDTANTPNWAPSNGAGWQSSYANQRTAQVYVTTTKEMYFRWSQEVDAMATNAAVPWLKVYHTGNTTKGSDGTLKAASPIARIASPDSSMRSDIDEDSFEWAGYGVANDKARGIEIIRDDIGVYRVLGANSLASSGWRLLPPRDPDGSGDLGVVTAEQLGDQIIITLFRRRMMLENGEIVIRPGEPIDVPANSWIDVRLDMPESAIPPESESPLETDEPLIQTE